MKKLKISKSLFNSNAGAPLRENENENSFFPKSRVLGRVIHHANTGDIDLVFPDRQAAKLYAEKNPHTWARKKSSRTGTFTKKKVSWPAGLRYDAEISRFGGQSPYWDEAGSVDVKSEDIEVHSVTEESYAGAVARLLKKS